MLDKIDDKERTLCEVWTRVMGYFRPVSGFNKGKKSEFKERKYFKENKIADKLPKKFPKSLPKRPILTDY